MAALPRPNNSGRRFLADTVSAAEVRISLGLAPEVLRGLLTGMLSARKLTRDDFAHHRYVLFASQGAEVLQGAVNYHVAPSGDLKLVTESGGHTRYFGRRRWRALGQLGLGILKDVDAPELLVIAVAPARRRAA